MDASRQDRPAAWPRRAVLRAAAAMPPAAAARLALAGPAPYPDGPGGAREEEPPAIMPIGIFLSVFSRPTVEARLDAAKALGLRHVQVGMDCVGLPKMPEKIAPELAERMRRAAADRAVVLASVDGTFNMSHPDAEHRREGLRRLGVLADACGPMGTSRIHICTGTRSREHMWHGHPDNGTPEAWRDMVACVREATRIAERAGVTLAFEPEVNNVVDSARKARRLLDEVGSPRLKVTLDGANLYHLGELPRMREILEEAVSLVGKDTVLAHAKDVVRDGDAGDRPAGHGKLDYDSYLGLLHRCGYRGPLLLHSLSEDQAPGCAAFLRGRLAKLS
ncbi:Xylose isomerase-like TIM barrel [Aquisphaera giovannonii]|uniref:Xylose isomerase-like TIM barrel n=1 Tax=Aquisphaera giovannonii TaxID=406548 RepID=A0A5B9W711_9BACT|nr:sugar phosphate isomerase/epimerase family protein [Aquisphaera giovannonii]QEH35919.1 Xylose isomerase-like TIM barrel [Aquisphaera giovannonii]